MKHLLLPGLALSIFPVSAMAQVEFRDEWLAQNGREVASGFLLPGKGSSPDLHLADEQGVSLGEGPGAGGDRKSLVMDGTHREAFRTEGGYPAVVAGLRVAVDVKPTEEIRDLGATVLRHGTSWELRHAPAKELMLFIIWHAADDYTEIRVPAIPGEWQTFEATYEEGKMTLTNGNDVAEAEPHTSIRMETSEPPLLLGASNPVVMDEESGRPFVGAVANIRIGTE